MDDLRILALEDDLAACRAMAGSKIHNLIGRPHHAGFMLNDQHGIAGVAQLLQNSNQSVRVSWMQTDTGFIEHK
jgi:hypothetical protein